MPEGRELLDEGWVYSVGCGGLCSTHNPQPVPPEDRGVAGRDVADCARGGGAGSAASSAPWLHGTVLVLVGFDGRGVRPPDWIGDCVWRPELTCPPDD